jgi:hypothetical protein
MGLAREPEEGVGGAAIRGGGARAAAPSPPSRCLCRRSGPSLAVRSVGWTRRE